MTGSEKKKKGRMRLKNGRKGRETVGLIGETKRFVRSMRRTAERLSDAGGGEISGSVGPASEVRSLLTYMMIVFASILVNTPKV